MRNLMKFGLVAAITMALWNPATAYAAQGYPSGSYQQTCRNIGVNGYGLSATCQDSNGNWQSTQLPNYQNCTSEIVNDNGALRCNATNGYNSGNYNNGNYNYNNGGYQNGNGPGGSYTQTCQNISTRGNTLQADCQTSSGQWRRTSLRNYSRCSEITNDNGTLRCTAGNSNGGYYNGNRDQDRDRDRDRDSDRDRDRDRDRNNGGYQNGGYYQNGIPGGSYTQSCQDIRVSGNTLKANCRKSDGHNRQTSLDNFSQCSEISNNNGRLRCTR